MRGFFLLSAIFFVCLGSLAGQTDSLFVVGYAYESNNRGFLKEVRVQAYRGERAVGEPARSNDQGEFRLRLPAPVDTPYRLLAWRQAFNDSRVEVGAPTEGQTVYVRVEMERLPGYLLEASLMELVEQEGIAAYSVDGATIEIYNNTMQREELRLVAHPRHSFSFLLEQGNEYIFLIRKQGYYAKRLRANINVNGCILCMEGFGTVTPGVLESLSQNNTKGILLTNIALKKMQINETMRVPNIYYDKGKAALRPEALPALNQLAELLRDNPQVSIELGSHTDARGSAAQNQRLSQARAESVVEYLVQRARISRSRIKAKGYGETRLVNSCADGVECSEELHEQNRRTEFTVTDIRTDDPYKDRSLAMLMQEENLQRQLAAIEQTYVDDFQPTTRQSGTKTPTMPQTIPYGYTGFKIEILRTKTSPSMNDPVFARFDPVFLDVSPDGSIVFLVGNFGQRSQAEKELPLYAKQYPGALVVEYREGLRQTK